MPATFTRTCAAVLLALAVLIPAGYASAQEHRLIYDRVRPVGSSYRVVVQGEQISTETQRLNGRETGTEKTAVSGAMTAVAEVLAVHDNKRVRGLALTVEQFTGEIDGQAVEIDTARRVVVSVEQGKAVYAYEDGTAIGDRAVQVLDVLARFMVEDRADRTSNNDMFRLDERRAVGSRWRGDNDLIAQDISEGGQMEVDPEDVESVMHFIEVAEFAGEQAAVFDAQITLKGLNFPEAERLGAQFTNTSCKLQMSGLLPLDPRSGSGALRVQMEIKLTVQAELPDNRGTLGKDVTIQADANAEFREIREAN